MADLQRLAQALQAADAAGDTAAATALAQEIRRLQGSAPKRAPKDPAVTARLRAEHPEMFADYKYKSGGFKEAARAVGGAALHAPLTFADTALNVGRSAVAAPVAGIVGAVTAPAGFLPGMDGVGARNIERVQNFIGGQPFTERGRETLDAIGYLPGKVEQVTDWAGQKAANVTGSPAVGAGVKTALQAAPALLTRGRLGRGNGAPDSPGVRPKVGKATPTPAPAAPKGRSAGLAKVSEGRAPSIEELRTAKNAAYKAAEEAGVTVPGRDMTRFKVELVRDMQAKRLNKKLHPDTYEAVQEILKSPNEISLTQLEQLRQIAGDARMAPKKADARLGSKIIEHIDKLEDSLSSDVPSFKEARALNQRLSKAETIDDIFKSARRAVGANYTVAGLETALRQKFRALADNKKRMRGFNAEERAAIEQFISGGKADNFLRKVGKFAPDGTISGWAAIAAAVANPALALVPAAGSVAKFASTRRGIKNANKISELVRGNPLSQRKPVNALAEVE
jgi:hypothetical protein